MPFPRELRRVPHSAINASRTPAFLLSSLPLLLPVHREYHCFLSFLALFLILIPNTTTLISGLISGFAFLFCYYYYSTENYQQ